MLAQQFGDGQHQVGRGDAFAQLAREMNTHHIWSEEIYRLAEHPRFRFDAAHTPSNHADAINHSGVAVGAHQCIGIINAVFLQYATRQIFQIHLMHDADAGRHYLERIKCLHTPFHEFVALIIALKLQFHVESQRIRTVVIIHLHRMIHHQIYWH